MQSRNLFSALFQTTNPSENELRNALASCLTQSGVFRRHFTRFIENKANIKPRRKELEIVVSPFLDGKYPDLVLACDSTWEYAIECKKEAPDSKHQIVNYRNRIRKRSSKCHIYLLTKYAGTISERELRKLNATRVLWSEVYDVLARSIEVTKKTDRSFLLKQFMGFLEEAKMSRCALNLKDVKICSQILRIISTGTKGRVNDFRRGIETHIALLDYLNELYSVLVRENSAIKKYRTWGPGYWCTRGKSTSDYLSLYFYHKRQYDSNNYTAIGFNITADSKPSLYIERYVDGEPVKKANACFQLSKFRLSNRSTTINFEKITQAVILHISRTNAL